MTIDWGTIIPQLLLAGAAAAGSTYVSTKLILWRVRQLEHTTKELVDSLNSFKITQARLHAGLSRR